MRSTVSLKPGFILIFLIFSGICVPALTQTKSGNYNQTDLIRLEYKYQSKNPVKYQLVSKITQIMDIQGQAMQNNIASVFGCSIKPAGRQDSNLILEITADTLGQSVESAMGVSGGPVKEIKGKVFNIVINSTGQEIDISEAEEVEYNVEGSGSTNLAQTFMEFFPLLPAHPVKTGDIWNISDSVRGETTAIVTNSKVNSVDKLEGIETIDGIECARISSTHTGTMEMDVNNQGMEIKMKGAVTGTGVLLFAIKEGYFIKQTVNSKVTGTLEITSPENMNFPMVMEINSVNEAIR